MRRTLKPHYFTVSSPAFLFKVFQLHSLMVFCLCLLQRLLFSPCRLQPEQTGPAALQCPPAEGPERWRLPREFLCRGPGDGAHGPVPSHLGTSAFGTRRRGTAAVLGMTHFPGNATDTAATSNF